MTNPNPNPNITNIPLPIIKTETTTPSLKNKLKHKPKSPRQKKDRGKAIDVKIEHDVFYSDDQEDKLTKNNTKIIKQTHKQIDLDRANNQILHTNPLQLNQPKIDEQVMKTIVIKSFKPKNTQPKKSNVQSSKKKPRSSHKDLKVEARIQQFSSSAVNQTPSSKIQVNQNRLRALPPHMQRRIDELTQEQAMIRQAEKTEKLTARDFTREVYGGDRILQQKLLNKLVNHSLVCWPDYVSYFRNKLYQSYDEFMSQLKYMKSKYAAKRLHFQMQEEERNYLIYQVKNNPQKLRAYEQEQHNQRQARFRHFIDRNADQSIDIEPFYIQKRSRSRENKNRKYHQNSDVHEASIIRQDQENNVSHTQNMPKQPTRHQLTPTQKNMNDSLLQKSTKSVSELQVQKLENQLRQKLTLNKIQPQNQNYISVEQKQHTITHKLQNKSNLNEAKQYGRSRALGAASNHHRIPNKDIEKEMNRINDRKKILASIQVLNRKCEEEQKLFRPEQRQDKQKLKTVHKDSPSNPMVSISSALSNESLRRDNSADQSDSRKYEPSVRQSGLWITGQSKGQKVKRLQILNRYHYNPFEQNEGQDHCEVWKKLMCAQINSVRNQYNFNTKTQEFHNSMIDSLLADVDRIDKGRASHYGKLTEEDFYVKTTYKPAEHKREDVSSVKSKTSPSVHLPLQATPVKVENLTNTKTKTNSSTNRHKILYGIECEKQDSAEEDRPLVKQQFPTQLQPQQSTAALNIFNNQSAPAQKPGVQQMMQQQNPATSTRDKQQQSQSYVDDLQNYYQAIFQ